MSKDLVYKQQLVWLSFEKESGKIAASYFFIQSDRAGPELLKIVFIAVVIAIVIRSKSGTFLLINISSAATSSNTFRTLSSLKCLHLS